MAKGNNAINLGELQASFEQAKKTLATTEKMLERAEDARNVARVDFLDAKEKLTTATKAVLN